MLEAVESEIIDELSDGSVLVLASDADELDVLSELLMRLCDRRCDSLAMWSPRSPEPQDGVLRQYVGEIDLAARNGLDDWRRRGGCLRGLVDRFRCCSVCCITTATGYDECRGDEYAEDPSASDRRSAWEGDSHRVTSSAEIAGAATLAPRKVRASLVDKKDQSAALVVECGPPAFRNILWTKRW